MGVVGGRERKTSITATSVRLESCFYLAPTTARHRPDQDPVEATDEGQDPPPVANRHLEVDHGHLRLGDRSTGKSRLEQCMLGLDHRQRLSRVLLRSKGDLEQHCQPPSFIQGMSPYSRATVVGITQVDLSALPFVRHREIAFPGHCVAAASHGVGAGVGSQSPCDVS